MTGSCKNTIVTFTIPRVVYLLFNLFITYNIYYLKGCEKSKHFCKFLPGLNCFCCPHLSNIICINIQIGDTYVSDEVLQSGISDGDAIMSACPSSQFIQDDQRALCRSGNDLWSFCELLHECAAPFVDVIWSSHPKADAVTMQVRG